MTHRGATQDAINEGVTIGASHKHVCNVLPVDMGRAAPIKDNAPSPLS